MVRPEGGKSSRIVNIGEVLGGSVDAASGDDELGAKTSTTANANDSPSAGFQPPPIMERGLYLGQMENVRFPQNMGMHSAPRNGVDVMEVGATAEGTLYANLVRRNTLLITVPWLASSAANHLLWQSEISPMSQFLGAASGSTISCTALAAFSRKFYLNRGALVYRICVTTSQIPNGAMVFYSRYRAEGEAATSLPETTRQYAVVLRTTKEQREFEIVVPYYNYAPWQKSVNGDGEGKGATIGSVYLAVYQPLQTTEATAPFARVNIYVRAGSDFEMSYQGANNGSTHFESGAEVTPTVRAPPALATGLIPSDPKPVDRWLHVLPGERASKTRPGSKR